MKRNLIAISIFVVIGFIAFAWFPVHALEIKTYADATGASPDSKTASSGTISSSVLINNTFTSGGASATAKDNGQLSISSSVIASGYAEKPEDPNGGGYSQASSSWSDIIINTSGYSQIYKFNFEPEFLLYTFPTTKGGFASLYIISISLNNSTIWSSLAELYYPSELGGMNIYLEGVEFGTWNDFDYKSNPYLGSIDLGIFGNGESFKLSYSIDVKSTALRGFWGDISDTVEANCSIEGNITSTPVPEPSTMLLLGSGLIGLVGYGRKKFFNK